MKQKLILILLMGFILTPAALAAMCGDQPFPDTTCQMLTPNMDCTTYSVINLTGNTIDSGSLTSLNATFGIYYFNVTLPIGDYEAALCDNTTREFTVSPFSQERSNMYLAIILGLLGVAFALFYVSNSLSEEHTPMRLMFILGGLLLLVASLSLTPPILGGDIVGLTSITSGSYTGLLWFVIVAIVYFLLYFFFKVLKGMSPKND